MALLEVRKLEVQFAFREAALTALRDVSFSLEAGERLGIVGESGAGKSVLAFSILNLISKPGYVSRGEILFGGLDLVKLSREEMRKIRGNRISMIFQDPMMTLNPVLTIGTQMVEALKAHQQITNAHAKEIAINNLAQVQIPAPEARFAQYPHELSGGMRQRVVIAISLLTTPALIIADEPSTALDVTIQAEIIELLLSLCERNRVGLILITHDLGVVSAVTQRTLVMYAGRLVEDAPTREIVQHALHPYTSGLINALPQYTSPGQPLNQIPGVMPSLHNVPAGCAFNPRCPYVMDICRTTVPEYTIKTNTRVACHMVAQQ
ncbi:MAG: ABC transporter ATP-binding protein [Gammaproteobacteria bacterium]|nr:ABC transporter ATP-binding protein [Gammaproteobacteria bacterium]